MELIMEQLWEGMVSLKPSLGSKHKPWIQGKALFYRNLTQRSWHGHLAQEILIQDLAQEILIQRSRTRSPTVLQDPDAEILTQRACTRGRPTEILHKVLQDPDVEIAKQGSCTRYPGTEISHKWPHTQFACRDPHTEFLRKRSWYRDLAQEVPQDPAAEMLTQRSSTSGSREILHKGSYRILMQRSPDRDLAQEIRIQRSCATAPLPLWKASPPSLLAEPCAKKRPTNLRLCCHLLGIRYFQQRKHQNISKHCLGSLPRIISAFCCGLWLRRLPLPPLASFVEHRPAPLPPWGFAWNGKIRENVRPPWSI